MPELSEIQRFYAGSSIFLTGGTGFIGKLTLESLLRKCPEISRVYMLVRVKKQVQQEQRLEEVLQSPIFDSLKLSNPEFTKKIIILHGDMLLPDLGLSEEDKNLLIEDVDVVLHCAATVRFDQKLSQATKINVIGARDLLRIAKKMHHLKAYVHVSTAYSNCDRNYIDEIIYEPKLDPENLIRAVDALNDDLLKAMEKRLLGGLPNTYTLTKQIAETVVQQEGQTLPVCIVRPSVVMGCAEEPLAGFVDNFYGPTGLVLGLALGLLRITLVNGSKRSDLVSADYAVNHILAAAWHIGKNRVNREPCNPPVMNFVSGVNNPLMWGEFANHLWMIGTRYPLERAISYPYAFVQHSRWVYMIMHFMLHLVPAYVIDSVVKFSGKPPMLMQTYQQLDKAVDAISYFAMREWTFSDAGTRTLLTKMSPQDRSLFNFDVCTLNWEDYVRRCMKGIRMYILKDPMETLPHASRRLMKLKIFFYGSWTMIFVLLLALFWLILTRIFSN